MTKAKQWLGAAVLFIAASAGAAAQTQNLPATNGAVVVVPGYGEVRHANDEVRITLMIEEQDKDKAAAASRVNRKMKEGTDIVRREDPGATLKTRGYYTYPVYPEDQPQPRPAGRVRQPAAWRVGQYLEVTTTNLAVLPKTVAAAQQVLVLNGLQFRLSDAATKFLDQKRIAAAYLNLTERIEAIARAMGRNPSEAVLDTVDLDATGAYAPQAAPAAGMTMRSSMQEAAPIEEPSFEPGETVLQMRIVGRVRFK